MNGDLLEKVVEAVLYEGYILYPYRASSRKNRQRFTFGRVYPYAYHQAQGSAESYTLQTECLVRRTSPHLSFRGSVRFLQPVQRLIGCPSEEIQGWPPASPPHVKYVSQLDVDGQLYAAWLECVERRVAFHCDPDHEPSKELAFSFSESTAHEVISDRHGHIAGLIVRKQEALEGGVTVSVSEVDSSVVRLTVHLSNSSDVPENLLENEAEVLMRTFASTHVVLRVQGGEFLSLTDPPLEYRPECQACKNVGCWPVLVGDEAHQERDTILASPIILPDYPTIAAESAGTLFDGLEIDEILTLRIMTMTDEEKREMRNIDEQARALLHRTESLDPEQLLRMHGVIRGLKPVEEPFENVFGDHTDRLEGVEWHGAHLHAGSSVSIHPRSGADIMDMALAGKIAEIEAIEQDAEGQVHLAVVFHDDPGKDFGLLRQPGHRFFYRLDEVEPVYKEASP